MASLKELFGPPDVEQLRSRGNVEGLIKALNYKKDAKVRETVARTLGRMGDRRAVEPLIAALKDPNHWVRMLAVGALGKLGDARAAEPLAALREDRDARMKAAVTEALNKIGV